MAEERGKLLETVIRDGCEVPAGAGGERVFTRPLPIRHSCELGEDKPTDYRAALYVDDTGVVPACSAAAAIARGRYNSEGAQGLEITSKSHDFSALIVQGGRYALQDAVIDLDSDADGRDTCDFVGLGSAVAAFAGARVTLDNCDITTRGVARCALYCDDTSEIVAKNCRLSVQGGRLYDGYVNSADFNYMVATPWVLGIMGNARATNLMGDRAAMVLAGCDVKAANWGVLSTDNGEGNVLAVIDSTLTVTGSEEDRENPFFRQWGSGYGTYILGCDETFYGVKIYAGTYIGIAREGNAVYRSSRGTVKVLSPADGRVLYEAPGRGVVSELCSDGFGLMAHDRAELTLTEGTLLKTGAAAFLLKAGGVNILVEDGARILPGDGVLLQIIDDDDKTVGVDWGGEKELQFNTVFTEKPGWPSENGQVTRLMPPPDPTEMPPMPPMDEGMGPPPEPRYDVSFTARDTDLEGDICNGSGYYRQQAKQLVVTLGAGTTLTGCISATETIHVDQHGRQNTRFTSREYYYLGRVANRPYFHGDNTVEVRLEPRAVWNVRGTGLITSLTVAEGAVFRGRASLDGTPFTPAPGRVYTGIITVSE